MSALSGRLPIKHWTVPVMMRICNGSSMRWRGIATIGPWLVVAASRSISLKKTLHGGNTLHNVCSAEISYVHDITIDKPGAK